MQQRTLKRVAIFFCLWSVSLPAQDFKLFDRTVQVHGFASQGYVYTAVVAKTTVNS